MKKVLLLCSVFACWGILDSAAANDISPSEHSWAGFYGSVLAGVSSSNLTVFDGPENANCWWCVNDYGSSAGHVFVGGQVGYNRQFNRLVLGIEGEIASGLVSGQAFDPTHTGPRGKVDGGLFGAITGRMGYSVGPALIYGKAGWGAMEADMSWADPVYSSTAAGSTTVSGLVFGGGIEYAVSPAVALKAEYLRLNNGGSALLNVVGYPGTYQQRIGIGPVDTFRVGVSFNLNASH